MKETDKINIKIYNCSLVTSFIDSDCERIYAACNEYDKIKVPYFIDDEPEMNTPGLICAYIKDYMVGFISVYVIDDANIEICGFVHPDYRRNHIFSLLFEKLSDCYPNCQIQVSLPKDNVIGKTIAQPLHFSYASTECKMSLSKMEFLPQDSQLILSAEECEDSTVFYLSDLSTDFGVCMVSISDNNAVIHNVEVYGEYRGMGYGYDLICLVLNQLFQDCDNVFLHVTAENIPAYNLYKKLGFQCTEAIELWTFNNNQIKK